MPLKPIIITGALLMATVASWAAGLPIGPGSMTPFGPSSTQNTGGGGGPPACSNILDFSVACNSQYLNTIINT